MAFFRNSKEVWRMCLSSQDAAVLNVRLLFHQEFQGYYEIQAKIRWYNLFQDSDLVSIETRKRTSLMVLREQNTI